MPVGDDGPADPFVSPDLPDLNRLAGNVAGFYTALQAHGVPEQRAAEFTTVFLQTWIPCLMMANAAQPQPGEQGQD